MNRAEFLFLMLAATVLPWTPAQARTRPGVYRFQAGQMLVEPGDLITWMPGGYRNYGVIGGAGWGHPLARVSRHPDRQTGQYFLVSGYGRHTQCHLTMRVVRGDAFGDLYLEWSNGWIRWR